MSNKTRVCHLGSINSHIYMALKVGGSAAVHIFNSLWPSDTKWRHRFGSTLAKVMACWLMAPSHYLDGLVQEIFNSSVLAVELHLSCTYPSIWTNVDLSSIRSSDIHLRASSRNTSPSITKINMKITYLQYHSILPWSGTVPLRLREILW